MLLLGFFLLDLLLFLGLFLILLGALRGLRRDFVGGLAAPRTTCSGSSTGATAPGFTSLALTVSTTGSFTAASSTLVIGTAKALEGTGFPACVAVGAAAAAATLADASTASRMVDAVISRLIASVCWVRTP